MKKVSVMIIMYGAVYYCWGDAR